ncbi:MULTISPECIES: hypothetical protein [Citrobacter freundii complex]|jgi:regulator of replication initiation timing|uniref:hypothetical protein n=1 Tax=Citrobacter freundii complex TaxID=1344959 RepID=UPI001CEF8301|nr:MULTISPECIES: hypothetical protein [Citrobacter freundii complex]MDE9615159.1 hypothetical protein [Citrobacter portucalensis]WOR27070.1 hypothetical protein R2X23_10500 [Citrobacter braakii]
MAAKDYVRLVSATSPEDLVDGHEEDNKSSFHDGNGGGGNMLEARVAKLEADISYIRRDVDELRIDAKSISQNMTIALERLESIKASLDKKPSTETVDKKISDAKLAVLLGVPTLIAIMTGLYKLAQHYI